MSGDKYTEDGVNIEEGDAFSAMAGAICRSTFENSPFVNVEDFSQGHFRGPRGFRLKNLPPECYFDIAPDGVGTKAIVIDAARTHRHACKDLIAMTASDLTRWGGLPLVFVNVLDVNTLGEVSSDTNIAFREMMSGLGEVAKAQNFVCFRGETAELGVCVGSDNVSANTMFNWAGFMFGVYHPNKMITGDSLKEGQVVIALQEYGFRSNGLSSVRKALQMQFGEEWWTNEEAKQAIMRVAEPSILYDRLIASANGWYSGGRGVSIKQHLVSHISGGGIVSKFAEDMLFPRGLGAELNELFDPPSIMKDVAKWRGMSDEECYKTFNCGNGMLVVIDKITETAFLSKARSYGIHAKKCGIIVKDSKPSLSITSGFSGEELVFTA